MSEFKFENQGSSTYLVYQVEDEQNLDMLTLGMLTNNHIEHFVPVVYVQQDAKKYLKYNVTSKVTVQQLWEDTISKKHLVGVLKGLVSAFLNAEEYMIDMDSFVFDEDKIFIDISTGNTELICIPVTEKREKAPDMKAFFKEILFAARLNPVENHDYFVKLINFINNKTLFSIEACKEILDEIEGETERKIQTTVQQKTNIQENLNTKMEFSPQQTVPAQEPMSSFVPEKKTVQTPFQESFVLENQESKTFTVPQAEKEEEFFIPAEKKEESKDEKEISWFYLMQHYNKENAALYKEQKARKKQEKEDEKALGKDKKKNKKDKKEKKGKKEENNQPSGFAVPGSGTSIPTAQQSIQQTQVHSLQQQNQQTQAPVSNLYAQKIPTGFSQGKANFGETTVLNPSKAGLTTVLTADMLQESAKKVPYLIRSKNNEKIPVNKPVFRIGKEKSYVDYFIADNTAISRSHANIVVREDAYYIVDTNSTNHTYVNGTMIESDKEIQLTNGAKIRLANEDFEFWI